MHQFQLDVTFAICTVRVRVIKVYICSLSPAIVTSPWKDFSGKKKTTYKDRKCIS